MTAGKISKYDEEVMASFAMNDIELPQGFDSSLTYYQWLCRRKPYPMGHDNWWVIGQWISAALGIAHILLGRQNGTGVFGAISIAGGILSFFAFVGAPVVTFGAFFIWMPHAFKRDLKDSVIQKLFQESVSSKEILSGLRKWAYRLSLRHLIPVATIFLAYRYWLSSAEIQTPLSIYSIGATVMLLVVAVMIWLLLAETGLWVSVSVPRIGYGGNYMVWPIFVLIVSFTLGNFIADQTQYYVVPHIRSTFFSTDLQLIWFCLIYSVLISLGILLPYFMAPRLLDNWKTVFEKQSRPHD
jgi:hypothetical protein